MLLPELVTGRLLRRYKRFLADVALDATGETVTAHCANPGAMTGLVHPGNRVWLSRAADPARKLGWSWELVEAEFGAGPALVGIHTGRPNAIAAEAIAAGRIPALAGYADLRREVRYGQASRVDMVLDGPGRPSCYVEVKNVHLMRQTGLAEFPDSVTARGARHLEELGAMVEAGHRAVMLFVIQMPADAFALAADIDPDYATAFARARTRGVEAEAWVCRLSPHEIVLDRAVPVLA